MVHCNDSHQRGSQGCVVTWGNTFQGYNVTIGKGVYMNFNCCLLDCAPITIGDNVLFGPNVQVLAQPLP